MNREEPGTAALARLFVWMASGIVPSSGRREWAAEWNAELCHVCRSRACDPVRFTLGAFQDALCIRSDQLGSRVLSLSPHGSPVRCLVNLLLLAAIGLLLCFSLSGARHAVTAVLFRRPADLVIISSRGYEGTQFASIPVSDYQEWKTDTSQLFTQIAFFRPVIRRLRLNQGAPVNLALALASDNLPQMLDFPDLPATRPDPNGRKLFLTQSLWRAQFHADSQVIGTKAVIDGQPAVIAGVLPDGRWPLSGRIQALLTENSQQLDSLSPSANGFVFARLRRSAFPRNGNNWHSIVEVQNGAVQHFDCIPFVSVLSLPIGIFFFALLMACIALPATTALRLGDYPERRGRIGRVIDLRRWSFLLVKLVLVVAMSGLWSFALAYAGAPVGSSPSLYIQLGTSFPGLLFGFRWALYDQRRRCPVCLRLLSNPARVGQPSCNFLAWCGIELMCQRGHGLLHIPELPTCWFSTQRWLCLDNSWASLFSSDPAAS